MLQETVSNNSIAKELWLSQMQYCRFDEAMDETPTASKRLS